MEGDSLHNFVTQVLQDPTQKAEKQEAIAKAF